GREASDREEARELARHLAPGLAAVMSGVCITEAVYKTVGHAREVNVARRVAVSTIELRPDSHGAAPRPAAIRCRFDPGATLIVCSLAYAKQSPSSQGIDQIGVENDLHLSGTDGNARGHGWRLFLAESARGHKAGDDRGRENYGKCRGPTHGRHRRLSCTDRHVRAQRRGRVQAERPPRESAAH